MPAGIDLTTVLDQTVTIRASVRDVERTLVISIALVILVVFRFSAKCACHAHPQRGRSRLVDRNVWRDVSVPAYSLDNLSLMALTISTGFVVDDAIVVIENITRYLEQGMRPMEAALQARRKSASPCFRSAFLCRRIHSHFADGRHRRPPVSRVRGHLVGGDSRFPCCFADDDAHDVCPLLKHVSEERHGRSFEASEKFFQRHVEIL